MKRLTGLTSGQIYMALAPQPSDYVPLQIGPLNERLPLRAIRRRQRRLRIRRTTRLYDGFGLEYRRIVQLSENTIECDFRFRYTISEKRAMVALIESLSERN